MKKIKAKQYEQLKKYLVKQLPDDHDKIDLRSLVDMSLTFIENKGIVDNEIDKYVNRVEKLANRTKSEMESDELKARKRERDAIKKETERIMEKWKQHRAERVSVQGFFLAEHFVRMSAKGVNSTILIGEGGIGKSYLTIGVLKEELSPHEWTYLNSYSTPLSFYEFLWQNSGKVIVLDDVQGLLNNKKSLAILKSALWEVDGKRVVYNLTTAKYAEQKGLPQMFEFTGQIIILANRIKSDIDTEALKSRCNFCEINLTHLEKLQTIYEITKIPYKTLTTKQREEVYEFLSKETDETTQSFNFRTLIKLYNYRLYNEKLWRVLARKILVKDKILSELKRVLEECATRQQQINEFSLSTGCSRATFYRALERYKRLVGQNGN